MRALLVIAIVVAPVLAVAKPSVAVAPLDGDKGNKVGKVVAKEAGADDGPKETGKAMEALDLSGDLSKKDVTKLRKKLGVDVIIQGKVEDEGDESSVELSVSGKGVKTSKLKLRYKSATSSKFAKDLRAALDKRLEKDDSEGDDDADEDRPKKKDDDEDRPKKKLADDDEDRPKKKKSDDDEDRPRKKKVADSDDDEDSGKIKKRRHRDDSDDDAPERNRVTQVAIRLNAGAGFGRRGLTYSATGTGQPPSVGTAAPSGRVEVEAYPGAMDTLKGFAASVGIYADYDMTFGNSIKVPGSGGKSAAISQSHYSIGARYRIPFGANSFAFGVGYEGRKYTADRSGLGMTTLDMPDVKYKAVVPNVVIRVAATPTVGVFGSAGFLLLLDAGPIATNANFGHAKSLAFEVAAGADIALAKGYGLRLAAEVNQIGLDFAATNRGVTAATDRTIGAVASFEVLY